MKKTRLTRALMMLITVFSLTLITVYAAKLKLPYEPQNGIYHDTIYNRAALSEIKVKAEEDFSSVENVSAENVPPVTENIQNTIAENVPAATASANQTAALTKTADPGNIKTVNVYNHKSGTVFEMPLEEYVLCVVAAEMPADSPAEALKAQAVAVRTLAVNYIFDEKKQEHNGADICTNSAHCQAFVQKEEFIKQYGTAGENVLKNAENAANATKDLILTYKEKPIIAVFHASSGGKTASGKEVWGGNLDYLASVETSEIYDDTLKDKVVDQRTVTRQELFQKLSAAGIENLDQYKNSPFHTFIGGMELSESGRVASLNIAGKSFTGREIRSIFSLRSAAFEISFDDNSVTFITKGYGHGVGMSQLGAVSMARDGESFYSILGKYYPGAILSFIGN